MRIERAVLSCWTGPRRWLQRGGLSLWSLAALLLSRRFPKLALVADGRGIELLSERLGLPFTHVELMPRTAVWTQLTHCWALGKLFAVANEAEPFLHFDHDVLLSAQLPDRILTAPVVFERPVWLSGDPAPEIYDGLALPHHWQRALMASQRSQWGCGMMGGMDWGRVVDWAAGALAVAERNVELLKERHGSRASIFLEQWSAARAFTMADVEPLFDKMHPDSRDEFWGSYTHLGGPSKTSESGIARVAQLLEREWPGQLAKCQALEAELIASQEVEELW